MTTRPARGSCHVSGDVKVDMKSIARHHDRQSGVTQQSPTGKRTIWGSPASADLRGGRRDASVMVWDFT
ncbi:hypothetical protein FRAHR75_120024 [Frankia sp. Hr75.2]|nr:hypothetical protein FRAHR75_120024 [Frankia sp. Hr75.2]